MFDDNPWSEKTVRYEKLFLSIARTIAERMSFCQRLKVGAVAVKNGRIISMGWNGQPSGFDNACEVDNKTLPTVLHAESNLITKLARSTESSEECDVFLTHSPCLECAKLLHQAGVRSVTFIEEYRSSEGLNFLRGCGIIIGQYPIEEFEGQF